MSASEFRAVPGFGRYKVSAEGVVLNRFGQPFKLEQLRGYLTVKAWSDDDRRIRVGVHQLVALAFIGPRPSPLHEVAHWDGVRTNNAVSNLRWATGAENHQDKIRHGTHRPAPRGGRRPILAVDQIEEIRRRYTGRPGQAAEMAGEFGVGKTTIRRIARGYGWTSLPLITDRDRIDWLLRHVSGAEWRRLGIVYSAGCTRNDIDAAIRGAEGSRPEDRADGADQSNSGETT